MRLPNETFVDPDACFDLFDPEYRADSSVTARTRPSLLSLPPESELLMRCSVAKNLELADALRSSSICLGASSIS